MRSFNRKGMWKRIPSFYFMFLFVMVFICMNPVKGECKETNGIIITKQPVKQYTRHSGRVVFSVEAKGDQLTYQWYVKKTDKWGKVKKIKHSNEKTLTVDCRYRMNGWKYRCLVKDAHGNEKWSKSAKLVITDKGKKYRRSIATEAISGMFFPKSADKYCYVYPYYSHYKKEIRKAIDRINETIGMTFIYTESPHIADIVISDYTNNRLRDSMWLISNEIALVRKYGDEWAGVAFSDPDMGCYYLVLLNHSYLDTLEVKNIQAIVMHELGHCIGLEHSYFNPDDIMAEVCNGNPVMTENDIKRFKQQRKMLRNIINAKHGTTIVGNQFCVLAKTKE